MKQNTFTPYFLQQDPKKVVEALKFVTAIESISSSELDLAISLTRGKSVQSILLRIYNWKQQNGLF